MRFAFPWIAYATPLLLLLAAGAQSLLIRRRSQRLFRFTEGATRSWADPGFVRRRVHTSRALVLATLACLLLSAAGPMVFKPTNQSELRGIPYLIALDASRSMLAGDVRPSRWSAATNSLDRFLADSRGDRVGLITFSGVAYLNAPLTFDMVALRMMLRYLDPNAIEDPGSSLASAIERAARYFSTNQISPRLLVVVSDGEDLAGNPLDVARRLHNQMNLQICTVGVGTAAGSRVPLNRPGSAAKNSFGQEVISRLNEGNLQRLAAMTGGRYYRLGDRGEGLDALRREIIAPMAESAARADLRQYRPLFQVPLLLGLIGILTFVWTGADRHQRPRPLGSIAPIPQSS
jgi:Ca-activated chloride channel homolog